MSAVGSLFYLIKINPCKFSKEEILFLEAEIFIRIYEEIKEVFREKYRNYFRLMKFTLEMENAMLESDFIRLIIKDILLTEEYTLQGIAQYTNTHEDVVCEIAIGKNESPSAMFFRRIIDLHRSVRRDLYREIMKKITSECSVLV